MDKPSDVVTTTKQARKVIEEVAQLSGAITEAFRREAEKRAEHGRKDMLQFIKNHEETRGNLINTLQVVSRDLYTSHARFLMEVIQNADDNNYLEGQTPIVSITVLPAYVKIECNEVGFTEENVRAICRSGQSSKTPGHGYTGEKGLGFKSVFKLANQAHIRSQPYSFQLDQRRDLGMITPQWDDHFFADHPERYQTTIILDHICDESRTFSTALEKDIEAIDPVLILFLRSIDRLHLALYTYPSSQQPRVRKRFCRVGHTRDSGIISLKDEDNSLTRRFYKQTLTVDFEGIEERRPHFTKTEIVLAFPVQKESDSYVPLINSHNLVYAYLPLDDFGFKFIIQADFLTTSNRQSVDEDSDWNENITNAIPHAFEAAIDEFNNDIDDESSDLAELARRWPLYLDLHTRGLSEYWRSAREQLKEYLRSAMILKTRSGSFEMPTRLMFLDWAHDSKGDPIFGRLKDYVSPKYPDSVREALSWLGVITPNWSWVLRNIQRLREKDLLPAKLGNNEWCSDIAKVIIDAKDVPDTEKAIDLKDVPLIPLTDGSWRCSPTADDPIYFPTSLGTIIPPGLPLSLVDEVACKDTSRKKLFRLLGVKECDVPNVIERIFDHHISLKSAEKTHVIAQLQYLYRMREHVQGSDMKKIRFVCSAPHDRLKLGSSIHADFAGELRQLFSGYAEAIFLHQSYFNRCSPTEKIALAEWLQQTAGMALAPRLQAPFPSSGLHRDFQWLLDYKGDRILATLRQNWCVYKKKITRPIKEAIREREFICKSGCHVALRKSFLPLRSLVEKVQEFADPDSCNFISLPSGKPEDWTFLSTFDVGQNSGLDFYLWVHAQCGFQKQESVYYSRQLYLAIESLAFSPDEMQKVRKDIGNPLILLTDYKSEYLRDCVWHGPKGLTHKHALSSTYGYKLRRFFQDILEVPDATSGDALDLLKVLKKDDSTEKEEVIEIYKFLQDYCSTLIPDTTMCIAIPSPSKPVLEWKSPIQCVWDDKEFSDNKLQLQSKTALRPIVMKHMPATERFFTECLKLPNAGIHELLADLILMQTGKRDDQQRVYQIYERISTHRNPYRKTIREAFRNHPLVFIKSMKDQSARWLSLEECVWTRTVLRNKHALRPSLNDYRDLFRDTLDVPNATLDMLVNGLLPFMGKIVKQKDHFQYTKDLVQEIARKRPKKDQLESLQGEPCWPCRTPEGLRQLCKPSKFYVNDRQNLFDIFAKSKTFLDFSFDDSRTVTDLLRTLECKNFLSEQVSIVTEPRQPHQSSNDLTDDFCRRAKALAQYCEHAECAPSDVIRPLLENAEVFESDDIKTHYTLDGAKVTKSKGGCSVKRNEKSLKLEIYVSTCKALRECALITDFPEQLMEALELEPADLPKFHQLLQVPLSSLNDLMIREGFTDGANSDNTEDNASGDNASEDDEDLDSQSEGSDEGIRDAISETSTSGVNADNIRSVVVDSISVSARSGTSQPTPRLDVHDSLRSRVTTATGIYSADNRYRNTRRIQSFAQDAGVIPGYPRGSGGIFDMNTLRGALEEVSPALSPTPIGVYLTSNQRVRSNKDRTEEQRARDFEVGFLGEQFVYTLLHDTLQLPGFTGEENWTSSLRKRAGFSAFGREVSDFTYKDTQGALTRYFQQMQHPYDVPGWLATACEDGNEPLYRLEVKSTTKQDHATPFYMSGKQRELAKSLRVQSATPSEIYVLLRVSGLDALEDDMGYRPQWRVYFDPYTCGERDVLKFKANTTYIVTPTA